MVCMHGGGGFALGSVRGRDGARERRRGSGRHLRVAEDVTARRVAPSSYFFIS